MKTPDQIINQLQTEKIVILGLAREGISTYNFLRQILPNKQLTLADQKTLDELDPSFCRQLKQDKNAVFLSGSNHLEHLDQFSLIFKTPGIPASLPSIDKAVRAGVKLSSNLQLFLEIVEAYKNQTQEPVGLDNPQPKITNREPIFGPLIIGVTGTKGKSTVSALTHHILKENQLETVLIGNIGQPALDKLQQIGSKGKVVIEMSSHQLETMSISPDISIIQKITSEHLDYYPNQQAYIDAKKPISMYQKVNQYIIYNPNYSHSAEVARLSPGYHLMYQLDPAFDIKVNLKSHYLTFRYRSQEPEKVIKLDEIPLLGQHNWLNVMPAIIVGRLIGLTNQQIAQAIRTFKPLPHRLELITQKSGVKYVNDSMATMPDAQIAALKAFAGSPIVLIAGGHERDQDFSQTAKLILEQSVKALILFPPTGQRLWAALKQASKNQAAANLPRHHFVNSMNQAVKLAASEAKPGTVVLMSPGAASFGIFKNYADRGDQFRKAVLDL
ncbi:MAG: UDP-N-acetylmuramoyl-L-alanine--D-glutamate ligase [Candidatus Pacebacteria bacterium]|nr:UDP-N-acetylmuramoyl-L-alanine--D-glutamate ligase [Candidatus Paceibacterota bacterium]